ncbi:hypothetical protein BGZ76_006833 [Entomortierella beljakovae]|nr:hypothetical protein BGZ76_006833 [Entomortierella beljakovae]
MSSHPNSSLNTTQIPLEFVVMFLEMADINRCSQVCKSWSSFFKALLWWNAIQTTAYYQKKAIPASKEQEFIEHFQEAFSRHDSTITRACTQFVVKSKFALDILSAIRCNSLTQLIAHPGINYLKNSTDSEKIALNDKINSIFRNNKNLQYIVLSLDRNMFNGYQWVTDVCPSSVSKSLDNNVEPKLQTLSKPRDLQTSIKLSYMIFDYTSMMNILSLIPDLHSISLGTSTLVYSMINNEESCYDNKALKLYNIPARNLSVVRTTCHSGTIWSLIQSCPQLESVYICGEGGEMFQQRHIGPMPATIPIVYNTITSLHLDSVGWTKNQFRDFLVAVPNLVSLELICTAIWGIRHQDILFFPESLESCTSGTPTAYLKNLKHVVMEYFCGDVSVEEKATFLRSLPALETLKLTLHHNDIVDSPLIYDRHRIPDFEFKNVKQFEIYFDRFTERKMASVLSHFPSEKCTAIRLKDSRYSAIETDLDSCDLNDNLMKHKNSLQHVKILREYEKSINDYSSILLIVLQNCTQLKRLESAGLHPFSIRCTPENMKIPWACTKLEELNIFMDCSQYDDLEKDYLGIDKVTPAFIESQKLLFQRLGELTDLRTLAICRGGGDIPTVDFSLATGLDQLSSLNKLEDFDVRVIEGYNILSADDDIFYRICENMTEEDANWIVNHWPALKKIQGINWFCADGVAALKRLVEEKRPEIVFEGV